MKAKDAARAYDHWRYSRAPRRPAPDRTTNDFTLKARIALYGQRPYAELSRDERVAMTDRAVDLMRAAIRAGDYRPALCNTARRGMREWCLGDQRSA